MMMRVEENTRGRRKEERKRERERKRGREEEKMDGWCVEEEKRGLEKNIN